MIVVVFTVSSFFHWIIFLSLMTLLLYRYYYGTLFVLYRLSKTQHSAHEDQFYLMDLAEEPLPEGGDRNYFGKVFLECHVSVLVRHCMKSSWTATVIISVNVLILITYVMTKYRVYL